MITNRMRRMSKRRQKIELSKQARLIAKATHLSEVATNDPTAQLPSITEEQPANSPSSAPAAH